MSRFQTCLTSTAALGANTPFAWINCGAGGGIKLRRMTLGCVAGATTPTSQQLVVAVFRTTSAGTTPVAGTINQMDPNSVGPVATVATGFAATPTQASVASWLIPFNTQSGVDLPWELLEEWIVTKGTANGLAFVNTTNALPAAHSLVLSYEWEE